nr:hypothetical protein [Eubacterium sp.]
MKQKIMFKSKTSSLLVGILFVFLAVIVEVALIQGFREDGRDGIIAIVILSIFFTGGMLVLGIGSISSYFVTGKYLREALRKYGKETIISNIEEGTIHTFRNPLTNHRVYFTNRFVVDPGEAIIEYKDIKQIYKYVQRAHRTRIPSIAFQLHSGHTFYLCKVVGDDEIMKIAQLCYEHNPQIVVNLGNETLRSQVDAEGNRVLVTPKEWTPEGRKEKNAKAMVWLGSFLMIFAILVAVVLPVGMGYHIDKKVNAVTEEERQELLRTGCYEYTINGYYIDRDINYNFGKARIPSLDNLYLFEMTDGDATCLGVITQSPDWYNFNGSVCKGYDIFVKTEGRREIAKASSGKEYDAIVIDVDDIVATYGIPSEEVMKEKKMLHIMSLFLAVPMTIVGLVLLVLGAKKSRK